MNTMLYFWVSVMPNHSSDSGIQLMDGKGRRNEMMGSNTARATFDVPSRMPSGMATTRVNSRVSTARLSEGSRRCAISLVTGTPDMSEVPRSPCRSLPPQMKNCLMPGWSRPIVCCI
ncbi:hypothetical protein G6F46_015378 [Rhizopus delemar]|nr:hypothetical protein G6F46_015378 [Rhizopus delemar]